MVRWVGFRKKRGLSLFDVFVLRPLLFHFNRRTELVLEGNFEGFLVLGWVDSQQGVPVAPARISLVLDEQGGVRLEFIRAEDYTSMVTPVA